MPTLASKRIREYLAKRNMTQGELAGLLDTTEANLSRVINGVHLPGLILALKIKAATDGYVVPDDFGKPEGSHQAVS